MCLTIHLSGLFKTGKEKTGKGYHVYRQGKAASSKKIREYLEENKDVIRIVYLLLCCMIPYFPNAFS